MIISASPVDHNNRGSYQPLLMIQRDSSPFKIQFYCLSISDEGFTSGRGTWFKSTTENNCSMSITKAFINSTHLSQCYATVATAVILLHVTIVGSRERKMAITTWKKLSEKETLHFKFRKNQVSQFPRHLFSLITSIVDCNYKDALSRDHSTPNWLAHV